MKLVIRRYGWYICTVDSEALTGWIHDNVTPVVAEGTKESDGFRVEGSRWLQRDFERRGFTTEPLAGEPVLHSRRMSAA